MQDVRKRARLRPGSLLVMIRGALPLGLPYTLSCAPLRQRAPFAWLTRCRSFAGATMNRSVTHLLVLTIASVTLASTTLRAHDPGLSALEIGVRPGTIAVSLSLAAADAALMASGPDPDRRTALTALVRKAIRLSLDGEALAPARDEVSIDAGGARVRTVFRVRGSDERTRRLIVTSDVPKRLARGHRQLLVVTVGGTQTVQKLLDAESDSVAVDLGPDPGAVSTAWSFLTLGNHHILSGADHLLFLAGLFLAAYTTRELIVLLTAFTVAHSISLGLVVIGGVHLPASIVEPLIAASIAWVGVENLIGTRRRRLWLTVFGFGLMHGFGFAGAVTDPGFGSTAADVAVALFFFNAGVESGQLFVAAAMLPLLWAMRSRPAWQATLRPVCSAAVAMAGGYWLLARL